MPFDIESKLVIGVASSALFDLTDSDAVFREKGIEKYRDYQRDNEHIPFKPGMAFPFIKRLLKINDSLKNLDAIGENQNPIEVILLSRNDPDTGMRAFESIDYYNLHISRAAFLGGSSPFEYIKPFNISLFLSANANDVYEATRNSFPAGLVLQSATTDDDDDSVLRIAFDFDGVIADDSAENVFQEQGLDQFQLNERFLANIPHNEGPLAAFIKSLSALQQQEELRLLTDKTYKKHLEISLVTSRDAPAHKRLITTLRQWNIRPDKTLFLGGISKSRMLEVLRPHIFFDDQESHLESGVTPSVLIPFGKLNAHRLKQQLLIKND